MKLVIGERELRKRARSIRVVVSDVDGVLTDGSVYYSLAGEELKRFSLRDGMGVQLLRSVGVETAFLTRETSPFAMRRAEKLGLEHCLTGALDKARVLSDWMNEHALAPDNVAYIGDDVNDLPAMRMLAERGIVASPRDGAAAVLAAVHMVTEKRGGRGAFREFADWIVVSRSSQDHAPSTARRKRQRAAIASATGKPIRDPAGTRSR